MTEDEPSRSESEGDPADPALGPAAPGGEPAPADGSALDPFTGPGWEAGSERRRARTSPEQIRRRTGRSKRRRRRRVILWAAATLLLILAAGVVWVVYTGLRARTELDAVRAGARTLRADIAAGDLDRASAAARDLSRHAKKAHDLTTGPVWSIGAAVPYLGNPLDTVRVSTSSAADIAEHALPALVAASNGLDPAHLRRPDGSFNLAPIQRVAGPLDLATSTMQSALRRVQGAPGSTWLGTVDHARSELLDELTPLTHAIADADVSAHAVPAMLGADGPRSYLVSFQNEAELRATGGLPGALAIVRADRGKLSFVRFESDNYLTTVKSGLNFGTDYNELYTVGKAKPYDVYMDSNVSPNFPYAAQIWLALWKAKTGQQLDGAMTIDPTALSYLLRSTGGAVLPDKTRVTAQNVVRLTQQTAYDRFNNHNDARKKFLLDIARAVSKTLLRGHVDLTGLTKAAAKGVSEHRLLVWAKDTKLESELARTPIAGIVAQTTAPYAGLVINNGAPSKLDYYMHASLDRTSSTCGSTRDVTVTIKLTNDAPAHVPRYVSTPNNRVGQPTVPTTNRSSVQYFATQGSGFTSVSLNGKVAGATSGLELGHPVFGLTVDIPRGQTTTIVLRLKEPASSGALITRMQPMVHPVRLTVGQAPCRS